MTLTWHPPSAAGAPTFAWWNRATFALVRSMERGMWHASVFPDGHSDHSKDAYVGSEKRGRQFIERWAQFRGHTVHKATGPTVMPHEGLKLSKPKGSEVRS